MINQLRPSIHHLGDQIIWVNSEIAKGRKHFNVELTPGVYDLFPNITWTPEITRYDSKFELDFGCKFTKFNTKAFTKVDIPSTPYLTIQFDTTQIYSTEITPEVRAYVIQDNYKNFIINSYKQLGFDVVDVGGMRWTLSETAYIMEHSKGHVGASSAFGVFSRCIGVPFTHIYYNCNLREFIQILPDHFAGYVQLFSSNGIKNYFKDDNLNIY
jgi:hypothetical protein